MDTSPEIVRLKEIILESLKGGAGSGNFGHAGRPGEVGGSGSGGVSNTPEYWTDIKLRKGQDFTYHGLDHGYIATLRVKRPDPYKRQPIVKIIKVNPNPTDMTVANLLLDREHGGEIRLTDRDIKYTSFNPANQESG